jgi:hypothetical protein
MKRRFGYTTANNKYGASKVVFKDISFDSRYERDRYIYLCHLQKQGKISGLRLQVGFRIIKKVIKLIPVQLKTKVRYDQRVVEKEARYHCDFLYKEDGKIIVEEFKSVMTAELPDYVLRRKLMVNKIYDHNERPNRTQWVFREVIYDKKKTTITDK